MDQSLSGLLCVCCLRPEAQHVRKTPERYTEHERRPLEDRTGYRTSTRSGGKDSGSETTTGEPRRTPETVHLVLRDRRSTRNTPSVGDWMVEDLGPSTHVYDPGRNRYPRTSGTRGGPWLLLKDPSRRLRYGRVWSAYRPSVTTDRSPEKRTSVGPPVSGTDRTTADG